MDRSLASLGFAMVLAAGCTAKPCDEARLAAIADTMDDRSIAARDKRNEAIAEACPKLPAALAWSLKFSFGSTIDWEGWPPSRFDDPEYFELRNATCPTTSDAWEQAIRSDHRGAAVFETCELARYGLLEPGEPFVLEDLDAFVLYEWLRRRRIDEDIARRIARGLMSAESSDEELMVMCRQRETGCSVAYERLGVRLPRATVTLGWHGTAPELRITADGTVAHDRLGADDSIDGIAIAADASVAWGQVADAAFEFVASRDGAVPLIFLALASEEPSFIPAWSGRLWTPPPPDRYEPEPPRLELVVTRDAIALELGELRETVAATGDCASASGQCFDLATLDSTFTRLKQSSPKSLTVELRIDRGVAVAQVVSLIHRARGKACYTVQRSPDEDCWFTHAIVDAIPPLYRNMGAALSFGQPAARRVGDLERPGRSSRSPEGMLATFEDVREELLACLIASPEFMAGAGATSKLSLVWGPLPPTGRDRVAVWTGRSRAELDECIAGQFDAVPVTDDDIIEFSRTQEVELTVPIRVEPGRN